MPDGVGFDNASVSLQGRALEDGVFDFTLKLTDTGSSPFTTTTAVFHWEIGIGPLVIVTDADIPDIVFNAFVSIPIVVAGGDGPYACEVTDAAENLPGGMSIPPDSCAIVGAPVIPKIGEDPPFHYFVNVRAWDHADVPDFPGRQEVTKTFELTVLVPPIIISTTFVPDGKCGTDYNEKIDIVDGVPPFQHSIVTGFGSTTRLRGEPGSVDGVPKSDPESAYALEGDASPAFEGRFPEGLRIDDETGVIDGVPRRQGSFANWTYWVQGVALPDVPSQNQWRVFSFSMADAQPPAMVLDPSVLAPGNTAFTPPNNRIPELGVGLAYSLQFGCIGGVPMDGEYDAPHQSQILPDPTEEAGLYSFSADFGIFGLPAGMSFSEHGLFEGVPETRSGYRSIGLTAFDQQLPDVAPHTVSGAVQFSVGPDVVVIAETLSSVASTTYDDPAYAFGDQTVEIFEPFPGAPSVRPLQAGDMAATHTNPTGTALSTSLSNIDFLHFSVNPTWWAHDVFGLCSKGPRASQHADPQRRFPGDALYSEVVKRFFGSGGVATNMPGYDHASNAALELSEVPSTVASPIANPTLGIYRDGGLLYGFDSATQFGVFVVRKDGKIYVPFAMNKSGGFTGFGDGCVTANRTRTSAVRTPQITVSPDGKFAAVKVKAAIGTFTESAAASRIVLFSLTGEKPFGGSTWRMLQTGSGGTNTTGGVYLYGDTLTLTNRFLYYMTGDFEGATNPAVIYSRHYVYRYEILGGAAAGARLNEGFSATTWTNTAAAPLATPFHRWMTPGADSLASVTSTTQTAPRATSYGDTGPNPHFFCYNYANFSVNSMAPHPFRVSANGNACVIVAGPDSTSGAASTTTFQGYFLFVDYDAGSGTPVFREISLGTRRRFGSPTRQGGFALGDESAIPTVVAPVRPYGWYDGPYSQIEVSDNGKRVAAVFNESTAAWTTDWRSNEPGGRENLILVSGTSASTTDPYSASSTVNVTSTSFVSPTYWRFGCLAFTRDNDGLVFWAGFSLGSGATASYLYVPAFLMSGSFYAYDVVAATRVHILSSSDGGNLVSSVGSNFTSLSITDTAFSGNQGAVCPVGAFYSPNGNFLYFRSAGPLNGTDSTGNRLVGVNMSARTSSTINGRSAMRAFAPTWVARRGFGPEVYNYYGNTIRLHRGAGSAQQVGMTQQVSTTNGLVFWCGYNQYAGPSGYPAGVYDVTDSQYYGNRHVFNSWYPDYGIFTPEVCGFHANLGGNAFSLTALGGSTSTPRPIKYLQPDAAGTRLAFIYGQTTPAPYDSRPNTEQVYLVSNIATDASGNLSSAPAAVLLEPTPGRAGTSMAPDFLGSRLYYSFTTAGNENNQMIVEQTMNAGGTGISSTRQQGGALGGPGGQAHFEILYAGR
jgi:hypothetical protein